CQSCSDLDGRSTAAIAQPFATMRRRRPMAGNAGSCRPFRGEPPWPVAWKGRAAGEITLRGRGHVAHGLQFWARTGCATATAPRALPRPGLQDTADFAGPGTVRV